MESYNDYIGKRIYMHLASRKKPVLVEIIRIDTKSRRGTKFRAIYRRNSLGKLGFILENDQWVIGDYHFCKN